MEAPKPARRKPVNYTSIAPAPTLSATAPLDVTAVREDSGMRRSLDSSRSLDRWSVGSGEQAVAVAPAAAASAAESGVGYASGMENSSGLESSEASWKDLYFTLKERTDTREQELLTEIETLKRRCRNLSLQISEIRRDQKIATMTEEPAEAHKKTKGLPEEEAQTAREERRPRSDSRKFGVDVMPHLSAAARATGIADEELIGKATRTSENLRANESPETRPTVELGEKVSPEATLKMEEKKGSGLKGESEMVRKLEEKESTDFKIMKVVKTEEQDGQGVKGMVTFKNEADTKAGQNISNESKKESARVFSGVTSVGKTLPHKSTSELKVDSGPLEIPLTKAQAGPTPRSLTTRPLNPDPHSTLLNIADAAKSLKPTPSAVKDAPKIPSLKVAEANPAPDVTPSKPTWTTTLKANTLIPKDVIEPAGKATASETPKKRETVSSRWPYQVETTSSTVEVEKEKMKRMEEVSPVNRSVGQARRSFETTSPSVTSTPHFKPSTPQLPSTPSRISLIAKRFDGADGVPIAPRPLFGKYAGVGEKEDIEARQRVGVEINDEIGMKQDTKNGFSLNKQGGSIEKPAAKTTETVFSSPMGTAYGIVVKSVEKIEVEPHEGQSSLAQSISKTLDEAIDQNDFPQSIQIQPSLTIGKPPTRSSTNSNLILGETLPPLSVASNNDDYQADTEAEEESSTSLKLETLDPPQSVEVADEFRSDLLNIMSSFGL
ncbi:hypothetical protein HDU67_007320 [Dinochytrium kinnereticum]|nr:hypothetical protein HDU67_007320 [Dinochytrium kinnereticum]